MQNRQTYFILAATMSFKFQRGLVWFRRDLRISDNAALTAALRDCKEVWCVFIFDPAILASLPASDRRVEFIHQCVTALDASLREVSGVASAGLIVLHEDAPKAIARLASELNVSTVFAANDYEPYARERDQTVLQLLSGAGITFTRVKDHVIFEEREIVTQTGRPYTVFTPYLNSWLKHLESIGSSLVPPAPPWGGLAPVPAALSPRVPALAELGFERTNLADLGLHGSEAAASALLDGFVQRIQHYDQARNYPAVKGPSYLGVHLRFGTVSIRGLVALALERKRRGDNGAAVWLSELCWRDFYFQILANFPQVVDSAFKPAYDRIVWDSDEAAELRFTAWCQGQTGYPLVDAAMAQINQTGYMHNRLRMVAGSFLVKQLGLDWRWGERYFAEKLNDFDLSANNGGWQWVSSSGCDAQPYFRIFNPLLQSEKFDPGGNFIKRYLPALARVPDKWIHAPWTAKGDVLQAAGVTLGVDYPHPIVDHPEARNRTLARYAVVKDST